MSYSASDFVGDVYAEAVRVGLVSRKDDARCNDAEDPSLAADLVLAGINKWAEERKVRRKVRRRR